MPSSLLRRARVPALLHYRGVTFYTEDAIVVEPQINPFDIKSDQFGPTDSRFNGRMLKVSCQPQGAWSAAALAVLYPWQQYTVGEFNTPRMPVASINTGTSVITLANSTRQINGTGCVVLSTGTLPTGITANLVYYLNITGGTAVKLYDTEAHAIAGGGPGLIAITGAGTGNIVLVQNTPLLINYFDGTLLTILNVAITKMPSLNLTAVKTPFGQVEFEGYTSSGLNWSDDDSLFTSGVQAITDTSYDPSQIPTVPYTAAFGDLAPFNDLDPRDGVQIDFNMELKDVMSDRDGIICRSIGSVTAMAKLLPQNLTFLDLLGEIGIQGTGAARGASLPAAELDIYSDTSNPYIALYGATLQNAPFQATSQDDPIKVLNFKTKRTFAAGVPQPVFFVGTAAP